MVFFFKFLVCQIGREGEREREIICLALHKLSTKKERKSYACSIKLTCMLKLVGTKEVASFASYIVPCHLKFRICMFHPI
jgi:hypothetical protein